MCIVIDTCVFHRVFKDKSGPFHSVKRWICRGNGKMVFGGSKYAAELSKMRAYVPLVAELQRAGRVVVLERCVVDKYESRVRAMEPDPDFDDPHLVAILSTSGCKLICTLDKRADKFLLKRGLYAGGRHPKIYRSTSHRRLLCDANIAKCCSAAGGHKWMVATN